MSGRARVALIASVIASVIAMGAGCGPQAESAASSPSQARSTDRASSPQAVPAKASAEGKASPASAKPAKRKERPLPAFSGWTLDNERLQVSSLIGKRLLIVFFNPEVADSERVMEAVVRISALRGRHNFEVLGVSVGSTRKTAEQFARDQKLDFRVIDDASGRIVQRLGLRSAIAMVGVDAEGYVTFGMTSFPKAANTADLVEAQLREALRLEDGDGDLLGIMPEAPAFSAQVMDSDEAFDLASHFGKPVVLIFFLHTCPHCHEALSFLKEQLAELPESKRPVLAGIELTGRTYSVRKTLRDDGLDFFPVMFDDDSSISSAYGVFAGVPDMMFIDAKGRIAWRVQGWRPDIDGPMARMQLAKLVGAPIPMLLRAQGYSGSEVCGVCHEQEHATWMLTTHATAFDTLVKHGSDADAECVGCHVVGFGEPGGYEISPPVTYLEHVGCETCHGRGGGHLDAEPAQAVDYAASCATCHDAKHSLGFEFATFLPRVSHQANAQLLSLPLEERRRILAERGAVRKNLLPTTASYVGSDACQECHASEYATWHANPHAEALASLAKSDHTQDANCLRCHTTAYGKGGFPEGGKPQDHPDLARVGCESCHGPGGDHVKEGHPKLGSIVSLGDKCDSCVILQICGGCHDDANDPGFEFEVLDKIEAVRHGTIEAGTGRKLAPGERSAQREPVRDAEIPVLLARAFDRLETARD